MGNDTNDTLLHFTFIAWQYKRLQVLTGEPLTGTTSLTQGLPKVHNK